MLRPNPSELGSLLKEIEAITDPAEPVAPSRHLSLSFVHGGNPWSRVLYTTKRSGLMSQRLDDDRITHGAALFSRPGPVTEPYAAAVAAEARRCGAEIIFVGDLDPFDLTVFLTLADQLRTFDAEVRYTGIDDAWLQICRRFLRPVEGLDGGLPVIQMSASEREHLRLLDGLPVNWDELIGAMSIFMLRGGCKLELEGTTNPALYDPEHAEEIERLLFP